MSLFGQWLGEAIVELHNNNRAREAQEAQAAQVGRLQVRRIEFRYLDMPREDWPRCKRMSFFMTQDQVRARTKTVTRRAVNTWKRLGVGDRIVAIEKGQGLKAGEGHKVLALLEVVDVRVEPLGDITQDDCAKEGFPHLTPTEFVVFYHRGTKGHS